MPFLTLCNVCKGARIARKTLRNVRAALRFHFRSPELTPHHGTHVVCKQCRSCVTCVWRRSFFEPVTDIAPAVYVAFRTLNTFPFRFLMRMSIRRERDTRTVD